MKVCVIQRNIYLNTVAIYWTKRRYRIWFWSASYIADPQHPSLDLPWFACIYNKRRISKGENQITNDERSFYFGNNRLGSN